MAETFEPGVLQEPPRRKLKLKISEIIGFAVIVLVITGLTVTLLGKLSLKHDVASARAVSDKAIADIDHRDGTAARRLGSAKFQSTYSAQQLTTKFKNIAILTSGTPTVDQQAIASGKNKVMYVIYAYPANRANLLYFVRVAVTQESGKWQLTNISGSATEANLLVN